MNQICIVFAQRVEERSSLVLEDLRILARAWSAQPAPTSPRPPRAAHVEVF